MSVTPPTMDEKDFRRQNLAIKQLSQGRSNATGTVTLTANAATTTVAAENCASDSVIALMPQTANAAAALATTYVLASNVTNGQFIISHANDAQTDKTFGWEARG